MTRTKKFNKPTKDRVVYEVKGPKGTQQVEASTTAELKVALTPLLDIEPYSLQATAHIIHAERGAVQGQGWSVRRLGVLSFVPDQHSVTGSAPQKPTPVAVQEKREEGRSVSESSGEAERPETPESTEFLAPPPAELDQAPSNPVPVSPLPQDEPTVLDNQG